ncbi:hypothetical protein ACER0C_016091 [Sarotherodon galilaeus]
MKLNIFCCLLACALSADVTAGIQEEVIKKKDSITLKCPRSADTNVTWSKEHEGIKVFILSSYGNTSTRHIDDTRFSLSADKSLIILRPAVSDSGTYLCNNEAAVQLTVIPEKINNKNGGNESVTLRCPLSVKGKVTWSREKRGRKADILTADGNTERRHIKDKRFSLSADKSLIILRPAASDSGTYLCNNKPAVQLIVISPEIRKIAREKESITFPCPPSVKGNVTWSRERNGREVEILTADGDTGGGHTRFTTSADKSLIILRPAASDSGTYLCNNEPVAVLSVVPGGRKPPTPAITDQNLYHNFEERRLLLMVGTTAALIIIIIILITTVVSTRTCCSKKQGNEENKNTCHHVVPCNKFKPPSCEKQEVLNVPEDNHIYHYIVDVNRFQSENGGKSSAASAAAYALASFPADYFIILLNEVQKQKEMMTAEFYTNEPEMLKKKIFFVKSEKQMLKFFHYCC